MPLTYPILVTSLSTWRETHRAEKYKGYFDFRQLKICTHIDIYYNLYKSCAVATPNYLGPFPPKNYVRIVAFTPNVQRASFYSIIVFHHHSTTIKLLLLTMLIKWYYLSLKSLTIILRSHY
jgi:hypothetical protein